MLFSGHTLFLRLNLQDTRYHSATAVTDLVHHLDQAVARWIVEGCGQGCLLALDGYSDLPLEVQWKSIYADIINCKVLERATILVTSRYTPMVFREIFLQGTQAFQHIEVTGFNDDDIIHYTSSLNWNEAMVTDFMDYLEANPAIRLVMHVPLYCAAVVQLYSQLGGVTLPKTLTQLHDYYVFFCITKSLGICPQGERKLSRLPRDTQNLLNQISKLAYDLSLERKSVHRGVANELLTLGMCF